MSNEQATGGQQAPLLQRFMKALRLSRNGDTSLRESLEEVIEEHESAPEVEQMGAEERSMLRNVLKYGDLRIDDIMVPRADIVAIEKSVGFREMIGIFCDAAHSRLPVYNNTLDDVVGMVHVKDAIVALNRVHEGGKESPVEELLRPVLFVAPSMRLMDLLAKMRARRTHMAVVIDEYGGTDGVVTIEDLVEQIVGDIEDEHDDAVVPMLQQATGKKAYDADARAPLSELEDVLKADLLPDERDEDIDTVGGLVFSLAGRIPQIGEAVEHEDGYRFEVLDADPRRLKRVRVHLPSPGKDRESGGD